MSEMAELRANGFGVPIYFPVYANVFAHVSSFHFSIKYSLQDGSIWIKREIYNSLTSMLSLTMYENSIFANNVSSMWKLAASKCKVYKLYESRPHVSIEIRIPPYSSASTFNTLSVIPVKIEPGIHTIIHLHDSSDGDEPIHSIPRPSL